MVTTEILTLLEQARKLIQRNTELNQSYFNQFIQPMWEAFVRVHNDYIASLREYIRLVSEEACDIPGLIHKMHQDSLFTAHLRIEGFEEPEPSRPDIQQFLLNSVNHELPVSNPKIGVRAYARTPIFGHSLDSCDLLKFTHRARACL